MKKTARIKVMMAQAAPRDDAPCILEIAESDDEEVMEVPAPTAYANVCVLEIENNDVDTDNDGVDDDDSYTGGDDVEDNAEMAREARQLERNQLRKAQMRLETRQRERERDFDREIDLRQRERDREIDRQFDLRQLKRDRELFDELDRQFDLRQEQMRAGVSYKKPDVNV